jgi:hypothetical protein
MLWQSRAPGCLLIVLKYCFKTLAQVICSVCWLRRKALKFSVTTQSCSRHLRFFYSCSTFFWQVEFNKKEPTASKQIRSKIKTFNASMQSLRQFILLGPREGRRQKCIQALVNVWSIKGEIVSQAIYSMFITCWKQQRILVGLEVWPLLTDEDCL